MPFFENRKRGVKERNYRVEEHPTVDYANNCVG
jgi:hypothetical protein